MSSIKDMETTFNNDSTNTIQKEKVSAKFKLDDKNAISDNTKRLYHDQRLGQSKWAFRLSIWGSILGFSVIIWSFYKGIQLNNAQWPGIVSGSVLEAVSALFYSISNKTNEKISEFFKELTKDENIKRALELSEEIHDEKARDELKVKLSLHLAGINEERICKYTKGVCEKTD